MLYYDVSDLVRHANHSQKVTGIQRVVLEGLRGLAAEVTACFVSPATGQWYVLSNFNFSEVRDLSSFCGLTELADLSPGVPLQNYYIYGDRYVGLSPKKKAARRRISRLKIPFLTRRARRDIRLTVWDGLSAVHDSSRLSKMPPLQPKDIIVTFGTPWNALEQYRQLFAGAPPSVRKVILVYDLIPLNSHFVPDNLRDIFRLFIPFALEHATDIIVNSDSVACDLGAFAKQENLRCPPISKVQLAHHLPAIDPLGHDITLRVRKLIPEKYALCVGSIESRKNHLNLLAMWAKFVRSPKYAGEKLVLAGAWLWDFTAIQNLLHETGHVFGSVIVVEHPTDDELRDLYRYCRITAFPSHYEGWGLPIGESLSFGKPCLHFDNSSLVEAGVGLTDVVPYHDLGKYGDALVRLMQDDKYYQSRTDRIYQNREKLRSWTTFSHEVAEFFQSLQKI